MEDPRDIPPDFSSDKQFDDGSEEVDELAPGYATRFGAGQPSNRAGRPKVERGKRDTVHRVASKRRTISENGVNRRLSYLDILITVIRNKAIGGDRRAVRLLNELRVKLQLIETPLTAVAIFPEELSIEEWAAKYDTIR